MALSRGDREWLELMQLVDAFEPKLARELLSYFLGTQASLEVAAIVPLVASNAVEQLTQYVTQLASLQPVFDQINATVFGMGKASAAQITQAAARPLEREAPTMFELAVTAQVGEPSSAPMTAARVEFDGVNQRVVDYLRETHLAIGKSITEGTSKSINQILQNGFQQKLTAPQMAKQVKEVVTLAPHQLQAINNYRKELETGNAHALTRQLRDRRRDRTVQAVVSGKKRLSQDQIDKMVSAYSERFLKFHAEEIALTQSLSALAFTRREAWHQAVEKGLYRLEDIVRKWYVAHDERVCPICKPIPEMNPDGVGLNELYRTPIGPLIGPLAHNRCRCVEFIRPRMGARLQ